MKLDITMKPSIYKFIFGTMFVVFIMLPILSLTSCKPKTEPGQPFPDGLPNQEIVFMPYDPFYFHGVTKRTIGFVDSEGLNRHIYHFYIEGGSAKTNPKQFSTYVNAPHWSMDGEKIIFTIRDVPPNLRIINKNGFMHGNSCLNVNVAGNSLGFTEDGNVLMWLSETDPVYNLYSHQVDEDHQILAMYDVTNCRIDKTINVPVSSKYRILGLNTSKNNILTAMIKDKTINRYEVSGEPYKVFIFNVKTKNYKLFPGYHPALSDDGSLLAYYSYSGELRIRSVDSDSERVLGDIFELDDDFDFISSPGWSPDNKWLVYNNRDGEIYKINVSTGERIYITDGYAPDWR